MCSLACAARRTCSPFLATATTWEIVSMASAGDTVFVERIDRTDSAGRKVDLCARHVQEAVRIAVGERPGFLLQGRELFAGVRRAPHATGVSDHPVVADVDPDGAVLHAGASGHPQSPLHGGRHSGVLCWSHWAVWGC